MNTLVNILIPLTYLFQQAHEHIRRKRSLVRLIEDDTAVSVVERWQEMGQRYNDYE